MPSRAHVVGLTCWPLLIASSRVLCPTLTGPCPPSRLLARRLDVCRARLEEADAGAGDGGNGLLRKANDALQRSRAISRPNSPGWRTAESGAVRASATMGPLMERTGALRRCRLDAPTGPPVALDRFGRPELPAGRPSSSGRFILYPPRRRQRVQLGRPPPRQRRQLRTASSSGRFSSTRPPTCTMPRTWPCSSSDM